MICVKSLGYCLSELENLNKHRRYFRLTDNYIFTFWYNMTATTK